MLYRKKTSLEIWETGKSNAGRPRKITEEEERLLDQLAELLVVIYLDDRKKDQPIVSDINLPVWHHMLHTVETNYERWDICDHAPTLKGGQSNQAASALRLLSK